MNDRDHHTTYVSFFLQDRLGCGMPCALGVQPECPAGCTCTGRQCQSQSNAVRTTAATAPPALERGIIYVQPSYHYTNTLLLDLGVMANDLDTIRAAGFTNVGLRVSWGELMSE